MSRVLSHDFAQPVCEALGIDITDLKSLTIDLQPNEVVVVTAVYMPVRTQLEDVVEVLKRFEVVEKEE